MVAPIPVAIARLDTSKAEKPKGGKLAQRAGILCSEGAFGKFLNEHYGLDKMFETPEEIAEELRKLCNVKSRSEFDHSWAAGETFKDIEASYKAINRDGSQSTMHSARRP
jgi:hypothetical protein